MRPLPCWRRAWYWLAWNLIDRWRDDPSGGCPICEGGDGVPCNGHFL